MAIGLDACELQFAEELIADGRLPNLAAARERSARYPLVNTVEFRSELPWTQFATGRRPEDLNYWSTVSFEPATYRAWSRGACVATPFYGGPDGPFTIAFDVPHSVIDPDMNGVQVTAWGAHAPQWHRASVPEGLLTEIDRRFGQQPAFLLDFQGDWHQGEFLDQLTDAIETGAARRAEIARWLMEQNPEWQLFVTVFAETHVAGHHMWHGADPNHVLRDSPTAAAARRNLIRSHEAVDRGLGRMLEDLPDDTTVILFSIHGMQSNHNDLASTVLLPELVHRLHFGDPLLETPRWARSSGDGPVVPTSQQLCVSQIRDELPTGEPFEWRRTARRITPDWLRAARVAATRRRPTTEAGPEVSNPHEVPTRQGMDWSAPAWYRTRWPEMRYFILPTFSDAMVRVNLVGREPQGVIAADDYGMVLDEIEQLLAECTDPRTGGPAVKKVLRLREGAEFDPEGPDADLVVLWNDGIDRLHHPSTGIVGPFPLLRTGEHSSNGFMYIDSPAAEPGDHPTRSAFDVSPTILAAAGVEPPPVIEGESTVGVADASPAG